MDIEDFYGIYGMSEAVCLDHFSDAVLRDQLRPELTELECHFCERKPIGKEPPFAVPMDEVGARVWEAMNWLYTGAGDDEYVDDYLRLDDGRFETNDVIYDTVEEAIDPVYSEAIIERLKAATTRACLTNRSAVCWES